MDGQTPAGWYADQTAPGQERYWDGRVWTDQMRQATASNPKASDGFEGQILQELQMANRLLAGIQSRTGVVATVIVVSLAIVLLYAASQQ